MFKRFNALFNSNKTMLEVQTPLSQTISMLEVQTPSTNLRKKVVLEVKTPPQKIFKRSNKVCSYLGEPGFDITIDLSNGHGLIVQNVKTTQDLYDFAKFRFMQQYTSTLTLKYSDIWKLDNFYFVFKGKPLSRRSIDLHEYNMHNGSIVQFVPTILLGGSSLPEFKVDISYNVLLEQYLMKKLDTLSHLQLQGAEEDDHSGDEFFNKYIHDFIYKQIATSQFDTDLQWIASQVDNLFQIAYWFKKCDSIADFERLLLMAYKLITGRMMYGDLITLFTKKYVSNLQADDDDSKSFLSLLRKGLTGIENINDSPIVKKVVSMYSYLLVHGFLEKFGFVINDIEYTRLEQKALYASYSSKKDMWLCILDTTIFICEKIHEFKMMGDVTVFFHSTSEYTKWIKEADRLLALAPFLSNLEAHNTTYFSFLSDLNDIIEKGNAYAKYTLNYSGTDCVLLKKKLQSLQILKNTEITRRASQKERQAPFGVLVYGGSSVAKSCFSKMLFYYYASLHGLDNDDHYRYVRNPADEYWSNFDSSKWCIQMDDIAFLHPNKTAEADPTLMEMLNVVNNVPYVPPQAALEDKGKTPVMAKLVVATTNAIHLNASTYFWCPLAVRRRLPFVISVEPKNEYMHENQFFIDPSKLTPVDGDFPNYWNITVSKIVPVSDGVRERAELEEVMVFNDVKEFLKFFGKASLEHMNNQNKGSACDDEMKKVAVCPLCLFSTKHCECVVQAHIVRNIFFVILYYLYGWVQSLFTFIVCTQAFITFQMYLARFRVFRKMIVSYIMPYYPSRLQFEILGKMNGMINNNPKWKLVIYFLTALASAIALYYKMRPRPKKEETCVFEDQGNMFGTVEDQFEKEERQNVWYNETIELTKFDLPVSSQSLVNTSDDELRRIFERNCVHLHITGYGTEPYTIKLGGVFLRGHYMMANNHAFRQNCSHYDVKIIQSSSVRGVNSNLTVTIKESCIIRNKDQDFCIVEILSLPPYKDITKFWCTQRLNRVSVLSLLRRPNGCVEKRQVHNTMFIESLNIEILEATMPIYMGVADEDTAKGDCGAIGIARTPRGCVIIGLHMVGYNRQCGFTAISLDQIEALISISKKNFQSIEVQGGGEPMLCLENKTNILTQPHHRSLLRYLEDGKLNVYGSFVGFRPKPKSHVCETPLSNTFLEYYNEKLGYGKPTLNGWEPWRKNIEQMISPTVNYDKDVLFHCVESFTNDILRNLPLNWEKELVFLSKKASVNGLPGVLYIDKLNRNTSMGFPWCTTKKAFLTHDPCEKYPDGVDFDQEVWNRVEVIEECYREGRRAYPVFVGHGKDEATALAKIEAKKIRLFTGAPVDWSLVVRSRLLSFVRLLQKNKFIFEAGPGTVCQSIEWGQIREYLTTFGEDRMVAGDYGKFDKRMIADFILAAFQIICNIHKAAGFSEEEVREIMCIGEDTAFPLCNMSGDLMEFFGTNPSGHPLTVIINSLVNSLYIRYCYTLLNPQKTCVDFKENVHLFTYGDDNIMGVSRDCDWFNHTAIQKILASIGVEYTMADKESESLPHIHINDCQFLKRTWRYDVDVGAWLCPLEEKSIIKSLTAWLPSRTIDKYAQMVAVISSANSEYFFYGKEIFEKHHRKFRSILDETPYKHYETSGTLPNWEELKERFDAASKQIAF